MISTGGKEELTRGEELPDEGATEMNACRRRDMDDEVAGEVIWELDPNEGEEGFSMLKRKRNPHIGMLDWLLTLAKNPCDAFVGNISPFHLMVKTTLMKMAKFTTLETISGASHLCFEHKIRIATHKGTQNLLTSEEPPSSTGEHVAGGG